MPLKAQDDDAVISLVESALALPANEREAYLKNACADNTELHRKVSEYVQWEQRMNGFLLEPFYTREGMEHPFQPGDVLDHRFRIVREVAQGGMGVVYEADDEKLERRIAIKCAKAGFGKRLPPEVRHATAISHPNVCKTFEIHTATTHLGETDFLTMEFLDGETLAERLARGPIPQNEAFAIAHQLCAGLAEAHRNKVIHGDLKSNNVILTKSVDGSIRAVITDFGLARAPETLLRTAQSGVRGGTPAYMAPELWKGEKASVASDIYALGVILYELACGRKPFPSASNWEQRTEEKPPSAHPKWDRALIRCLDPEPSKRFRNADEISLALAPRSRRWWLTAAAILAVAAVSVAVTYDRVTAPKESASLSLTPFTAASGDSTIAQSISRDVEAKLALIKGSKRLRLTFLPAKTFGATHLVRAAISREEGKVVVHAFVTDTRNQANVADHEFKYAPGEVKYAGMAIAGLVTSVLQLPALGVAVNVAAKQDYQDGLAFTRSNSTIDRALPPLERAVLSDPDSPLTWAILAEAQWVKYFITRDPSWLDRSSESLRQAQNRNLDLAPVHRVTGLLRANAGFYEQAEREYLRAIELDPSNGDAYRRLGQVYDRNSQLPQALEAFQKAAALEPGYFKVYQDLGACYSQRGDDVEAARQFEKCVHVAPNEPDCHRVLGSIYQNLGKFTEAEHESRLAVELGETPAALVNLGAVLMYEGKDTEAIEFLTKAVNLSPSQSLWWMNLGTAYRRTNQFAESKRAYRRGLDQAEHEIARDPRDGRTRSQLAFLCAQLGDRKRSETEIAEALQLSPESTATRSMAVKTLEALGKREESLAILRSSPKQVLAETSRWPDLADLSKDSRFHQLMESQQIK
jgi:serine/threonine-protein kinase